jgi:hypothetical protein
VTDATVRLQSWLDGDTDILSKAAVRAVLWEHAELQAERDTAAVRVGELETERDDDLCVIAAFLMPTSRPIEHWLAILANHFGTRAQELTDDPERFAAARSRVEGAGAKP